jgi:hypothetical protein
MNEARFEPGDAPGMRIVCHYCGFVSNSMLVALRHDACRPRSCDRWRQLETAAPLRMSHEQIGEILRHMTLHDGRSVEAALDGYLEKIEPVYR